MLCNSRLLKVTLNEKAALYQSTAFDKVKANKKVRRGIRMTKWKWKTFVEEKLTVSSFIYAWRSIKAMEGLQKKTNCEITLRGSFTNKW